MRILFLCLILSSLFACKKEVVVDAHPDFIGSWVHHASITKFKILYIHNDGKGSIFYSPGWKVIGGTQDRKWVIKNDNLHFGWTAVGSEKFHIDKYPTIAESYFITGVDTIQEGQSYMILDGSLFCNCQ